MRIFCTFRISWNRICDWLPIVFILVLRIGRNISKNHPVHCHWKDGDTETKRRAVEQAEEEDFGNTTRGQVTKVEVEDKDKDKDKYKDKDSKYTLYTHNNASSPWSKTYFFKHNIQKAVILKEGSQ